MFEIRYEICCTMILRPGFTYAPFVSLTYFSLTYTTCSKDHCTCLHGNHSLSSLRTICHICYTLHYTSTAYTNRDAQHTTTQIYDANRRTYALTLILNYSITMTQICNRCGTICRCSPRCNKANSTQFSIAKHTHRATAQPPIQTHHNTKHHIICQVAAHVR